MQTIRTAAENINKSLFGLDIFVSLKNFGFYLIGMGPGFISFLALSSFFPLHQS